MRVLRSLTNIFVLIGFLGLVIAACLSGCANMPNSVTGLPGSAPMPYGSGLMEGDVAGLRYPSFIGGLDDARKGRDSKMVGAAATEELWIISRTISQSTSQNDDKEPGSGELRTKPDGEKEEVLLPLRHTDVKASVHGYIGTVDVQQQFQNPYNAKIEAVYVFPLPQNAAVNEFVMTIGDRHIRGIIRERQEAEKIYQQAKSQGYVASLLTEERPNIFRQSVANIEPGKEIDVNIRYFQTLAYADGWYEFVFPMVVGPRYNPSHVKNGVGAVARGQGGTSGQGTEVQYLKPNERSGHDISLHLDVDAGVNIEEFSCVTHKITRMSNTADQLSVDLNQEDSIPNKDFVLRYRVAGERIKSNFMVHRDERGGYFTMMLYPPKELGNLGRAPMEMVFVLDCSGSMSGEPIAQAKAAIRHALKQLQPGDSFQIINFSERASQLGANPLEATPSNIRKGLAYVDALNSDGSTQMIEGIKAALDFPHDPERLRFVCFLTDGYIGNEAEILAAVHEHIGASRIFSFGVGSSCNRYLLDHMAKMGQGAVAYLGLHDDGAKVMDDFFERVSHPAMTDIKVDFGNLQVSEVYPQRVPDLFVGRPVILTGRFSGANATNIRVTGRAGVQPMELTFPITLEESAGNALPSVWARAKISELADQATYLPSSDLQGEIKQVALDYSLMSAFTAFLAVDSSQKTAGNTGTTVPVAVPVPEGVKHETTVPEK